MTHYVIKCVMALPALPVMLPMLYFRYHTMRYRFDAEGIRMSWGILFRHEVVLNYTRIQDIHLRSSWIERLLGLARIEIQTAAGSANAEMTLEGMADPDAMRDFLYSRMRGSRDIHHAGHTAAEGGDELTLTLREVAAELRAIRLLVEASKKEQAHG